MESNGVTHLGNDTFIAATQDTTDNLFLITGKLKEERITQFPLARRVRFNLCSDINLLTHSVTQDILQREQEKILLLPSPQSSLQEPKTKKMQSTIEEISKELEEDNSIEVKHSFHTSANGKLVAVISTGKRKHYLIDIKTARVCEFRTSEVVISAVWHPTSTTRLMLLLVSGKLLVLSSETTKLNVEFENKREVYLKSLILECKNNMVHGKNTEVISQLQDPYGRKRDPLLIKENLLIEEKLSTLAIERVASSSTSSSTSTKKASKTKLSPSSKPVDISSSSSSSFVMIDNNNDNSDLDDEYDKFEENEKKEKKEEKAGEKDKNKNKVEECSDNDLRNDLTSFIKDPNALIGMSIIPPSLSLPVILLVLCRCGDVFSIKINADGVPTSLPEEYDGRIIKDEKEKETQLNTETDNESCVHYLIRGSNSNGNIIHTNNSINPNCNYKETPLAIGSSLLDEDVGRHIVFVIYDSGLLHGSIVSEPDLLCRNPLKGQEEIRIHLGPTSHASIQTIDNATIIKCDTEVYLCVWPVWSKVISGWVLRREYHEGYRRLPIIGYHSIFPEPIALRLPYNISGASVSVGINDIVIVPQIISQQVEEENQKREGVDIRSKVMIVKIASLILAALYARGEKFGLTFGNNSSENKEFKNNKDEENNNNKSIEQQNHCKLEKLLEIISECYSHWICGYPHEDIDNSTKTLAESIQETHGEMKKRHIELQDREAKLDARVSELLQRQEELSYNVSKSQSIIRNVIVHKRGVDSLYNANETLGKIHTLLNELETLVEKRKMNKQ